MTSKKIQNFLARKFKHLKRRIFVEQSGIPYSTITPLINGIKNNPELNSLIKIANYFQCSLDEVTGRTKYLPSTKTVYQFSDVNIDDVSNNLRNFIKTKIQEQKIKPSKLSLNIGFSRDLLDNFIGDNSKQKCLGSSPTVALADYFDISIDQMIGRSIPNIQKKQEVNQTIPQSLQSLDSEDLHSLKQIKNSLIPHQQNTQNNISSSATIKKFHKSKNNIPSR